MFFLCAYIRANVLDLVSQFYFRFFLSPPVLVVSAAFVVLVAMNSMGLFMYVCLGFLPFQVG